MKTTLVALLAAAGALQAPRSRASQPPRRGAVALDAALVPLPVAEALAAGPLGVPAMAAVGAAVLTPLTMYRQGYSFSVGYGAAVAAMGAALYAAVPPATPVAKALAGATVFYGARLAAHLLARQVTVPDIAERIKAFDKTPRLQRLPLVAGVAALYALMASPLLFALRSAPAAPAVAWAGASMAWAGALVEAWADAHKFVKKREAYAAVAPGTFEGPMGGLYASCRHARSRRPAKHTPTHPSVPAQPNYFGEVLFWFGLLVGGAPSFGSGAAALGPAAMGCLGFYAIYGIMAGATKRLDGKQREAYGGQPTFDAWVARTGGLFPRLGDAGAAGQTTYNV